MTYIQKVTNSGAAVDPEGAGTVKFRKFEIQPA